MLEKVYGYCISSDTFIEYFFWELIAFVMTPFRILAMLLGVPFGIK